MDLEKWAICMTMSYYHQDQNSCRFFFSYLNLVVPVRFFLPAFLDTELSRGDRLQGNSWVPCDVPSLSNPTTHKGWPHHRGVWPILFSNSDVGSFTFHKNKSVKVLWDRTYGCSSLSEKTRQSKNLLQRQHFLLSYLKTLSAVRLGFEPVTSRLADQRFPNWDNQAAV